MVHLSREKQDLVNRTKKIVGQLEAAERALNQDEPCMDVLQRLAAARGAFNSLMGELMEDHIRNHMPRKTKSSEEAADDLIEIVRTYLKTTPASRTGFSLSSFDFHSTGRSQKKRARLVLIFVAPAEVARR